jgi:hypothetical protein
MVIGGLQMAVNRTKTMLQACKPVWTGRRRGFLSGFDSLGMSDNVSMTWLKIMHFFMLTWIEASTKSAVLLFTASEVETRRKWCAAGLLGGMGTGVAQAYTTTGAYTLFICHLILTCSLIIPTLDM